MNKQKFALIGFMLLIVVQIVFVSTIIIRHEGIFKYGKIFKFRCAPVDPYDAFRGRYVAIKIREQDVPCENPSSFSSGEIAYAIITPDKDGFVKFSNLRHKSPDKDEDYLKVKVVGVYDENVGIKVPFDRFYMKEDIAPRAESVYRHSSKDAFLLVRIFNGDATIENFMIGDKPIVEFIKEEQSSN